MPTKFNTTSLPKGTTPEETDELLITQIGSCIRPGVLTPTVRFFVFADTAASAFFAIGYGLGEKGRSSSTYLLERLEKIKSANGEWRIVFLQECSVETFAEQIRTGRKHFTTVAQAASGDSASSSRPDVVYDGSEVDTLVPEISELTRATANPRTIGGAQTKENQT
jgi:hypothetical protein